MKRFKVVGLCLVAVFALSAVLASSASAGIEYKTCIKANPKNTGNYTAKNCSDASKVAGTGKYERAEWNKGKKVSFKGKNVGVPKNIIVNPVNPGGPGKIEGSTECAKEKPEGEVTGPKTTKWVTTYKKCKGNGVPCNTTGKGKEEIVTDGLESTLVKLDKANKRPGIRVKGLGPGGRLAQYECPTLKINIEVYGEVLAEVKGQTNEANKSEEVVVKEGEKHLQSDLYEEETFNEESGKKFFEWGFAFEACVKEEMEKGKSKAEAEGACFGKIGGPPAPKPVSLISVVTGAIEAKAPATQNGTTINKGEAMLIEDN